jgi:hypothetical protein
MLSPRMKVSLRDLGVPAFQLQGPFRRSGIGTKVVRMLIEEAARAGQALTLGVVKTSRVRALYAARLSHYS